MPEGPEVKYIAKKLSKHVIGLSLESFKIHRGPYKDSESVKFTKFREAVNEYIPHTIIGIQTKGKTLYFLLDGPKYFAFSLHHGMEGSWCKDPSNKHIILEFIFSRSESKTSLYFQDSRRFGTFNLLDKAEYLKSLEKLGPDVYSFEDYVTFQDHLKSNKKFQKQQLCDILLDQSFISGIGNYMRADIMYQAYVDPHRTIGSLRETEICNLFTACFLVAWRSYNCKATTCGSYESAIHRGNYETLIYGKQQCPLGHRVEKFQDKNKRTVWWVPKVQRSMNQQPNSKNENNAV